MKQANQQAPTHTCNNCNKVGHFFHQCRLPITSYGIIVYRHNPTISKYEFLMIRRKDTFGYIDFIRGKYQTHNTDKIQQLVSEMSIEEKQRILTLPFNTLWQQLWGGRSDESVATRKFEILLTGENGVYLSDLVQNSTTHWTESEWEFPKGRRNYYEKDIDCALREFEEETGYMRSDISIIDNVIPYDEIFIGSNNKSYKHKYFLARMDAVYNPCAHMPNHQTSEVSKTEWKTLEECISSIRPYNLEKKQIITHVSEIISHFAIQ